jgi:four helix bundle suffix protein
MTQAARSGRQNIIEGSERASTSKETEMRLTDVALASLGELRGDYEIWILKHRQPPWDPASDEAQAVYRTRLDPVSESAENAHASGLYLLAQEAKFAAWVNSPDSLVAANALHILVQRAIKVLLRQKEAQGRMFEESGGFRERLAAVRQRARAAQAVGTDDAPAARSAASRCAGARRSPAEAPASRSGAAPRIRTARACGRWSRRLTARTGVMVSRASSPAVPADVVEVVDVSEHAKFQKSQFFLLRLPSTMRYIIIDVKSGNSPCGCRGRSVIAEKRVFKRSRATGDVWKSGRPSKVSDL